MTDTTDRAHKLHYAAYSFGFEAGKGVDQADITIAGNKAAAALRDMDADLTRLTAALTTIQQKGGECGEIARLALENAS